MQVRVIAVGKIKEKFLTGGIAEYEKRLLPYLKLTITEIADERRAVHANAGEEALTKDREGERILAAIPGGAYVVALDVRGTALSSEELAAKLHAWQMEGVSSVAIIIGGDLGLSAAVLSRADLRLSFSKLTFTHQMIRMILLEQLYRACRINSGEPYHK